MCLSSQMDFVSLLPDPTPMPQSLERTVSKETNQQKDDLGILISVTEKIKTGNGMKSDFKE